MKNRGKTITNFTFQPFSCDVCGRSFADRSNMRSHRATHGKFQTITQ